MINRKIKRTYSRKMEERWKEKVRKCAGEKGGERDRVCFQR